MYLIPLVMEERWSSANFFTNFPKQKKVLSVWSKMHILRFTFCGRNLKYQWPWFTTYNFCSKGSIFKRSGYQLVNLLTRMSLQEDKTCRRLIHYENMTLKIMHWKTRVTLQIERIKDKTSNAENVQWYYKELTFFDNNSSIFKRKFQCDHLL